MIVYTCPRCGRDLMYRVMTVYPPIYLTECTHCGWSDKHKDRIERVTYQHENGGEQRRTEENT